MFLLEALVGSLDQKGDAPWVDRFVRSYRRTWRGNQEREMSLERLKTTWSELREFLLEDEQYAAHIAKMDAYIGML
jgi:hypothetical protein